MQYRVRYVSDGGPVTPHNAHGWPVAGRSHRSLFAAMKELRDVRSNDSRVGKVLGAGLQMRLFPNAAWTWIPETDVDRYAREMRLARWEPARDPTRARRRPRRDVPATIRIRGRDYAVTAFDHPNPRTGAVERRYRLTGKRGASYFTMRNVHRPHLMFVVSHKLGSDAMDRVWLSDEGGALRVVEQDPSRRRKPRR